MKKRIGFGVARIAAFLWEKGGFWNDSQQYEDLTVLGKIGYNLFCEGLAFAGVTKDMIENIRCTNN